MANGKATAHSPAWQPLRNKLFLAVWLGTLASNIGTWMHDVGASWLMTTLTASPMMVALVQTMNSAPIMLLALPAGALADIVNRRRYLLATQSWMFLSALGLALCTWQGLTTDGLLIGFTFLLGCGAAMSLPAWAAVTPELVSKNELHAAITLNGLGINVSRAIGPAIAGVLVSTYGAASVFILNAVSFLGVIGVLYTWKRSSDQGVLPAERLLGAIRSGVRYARYSSLLPAILARGAAFFLFASALWALLPVLVSIRLHAGASTYGLLMAHIGLGAVLTAAVLPKIRARIPPDSLVRWAALAYAAVLLVLVTQNSLVYLCPAMLIAGAAWLSAMSSLQVAAQTSLPDWVRARGLSVFMMVFMGGMAGGSLLWGYLAGHYGIEASLAAAAGGLLLGIVLTWRFSLSGAESVDFTPSLHWPLPIVNPEPRRDRGPVLITIEYPVAAGKLDEFHLLARQLYKMRKRDGAYFWELFQETAKSDRYIECFMVESWLEHLRQHDRVSVSDRALQEQIEDCLRSPDEKMISHYIAVQWSSLSARR